MRRKSTDGVCSYCGSTFSKMAIKRHLDKCDKRLKKVSASDAQKQIRHFYISVSGAHAPDYWLYIDIAANTRLEELDMFLRGIWLECCGHMSVFTIHNVNFSSYVDSEFDDKSMNFKLDSVLDVGDVFDYEYDFGSPTSLKLKIVSDYMGKNRRPKIHLAARNVAPEIKCNFCDNPATYVCCICGYSYEGWVCDECIDKHKCEEESFLPVVNSPRVGVCAYGDDSLME